MTRQAELLTVEHESHPYDDKRQWLYMDAISQWVASASWHEQDHIVTTSNGSKHQVCTRLLCGESDSLEGLREWARAQIAEGATRVNIHETWPIVSHPNKGKRDNAFRERITTA